MEQIAFISTHRLWFLISAETLPAGSAATQAAPWSPARFPFSTLGLLELPKSNPRAEAVRVVPLSYICCIICIQYRTM